MNPPDGLKRTISSGRSTRDLTSLNSIQAIRRALTYGLEPDLQASRTLDDRRRWIDILTFPGLWVLAGFLVLYSQHLWQPYGLLLRIAGTLLAAASINAMVLLLHEGMHGTLFRQRQLNRWVSVLMGAPVFISFTAYQVMHIRHHEYLGDPRDPDDYHNYTTNRTLLWTLHYLRLLSGSFVYLFCIPALALKNGNKADRKRIVVEYLLLALIYALLFNAFPLRLLVQVWLMPVLIVGFMVNVRGFTQHGMTEAHDPFLASRSIHTNRLLAFFLLHENLHLEHHLFPEVPSYNLQKVHTLIWARLPRASVQTSYLGFLWRFVIATFKKDDNPIGVIRPREEK